MASPDGEEGRGTGALPDRITHHARRQLLTQIKAVPDAGIRQEGPTLSRGVLRQTVRSPWHIFRCSPTRSMVPRNSVIPGIVCGRHQWSMGWAHEGRGHRVRPARYPRRHQALPTTPCSTWPGSGRTSVCPMRPTNRRSCIVRAALTFARRFVHTGARCLLMAFTADRPAARVMSRSTFYVLVIQPGAYAGVVCRLALQRFRRRLWHSAPMRPDPLTSSDPSRLERNRDER